MKKHTVGLFEATKPCGNCPYRTDAPLKLWHKDEFKTLLQSEQLQLGSVYRCHKANGSVCVGWLMKQQENNYPSIALRIAMIKAGNIRPYLDSLNSPAPLYEDVNTMIRANYPGLLRNKTS